MEKVRRKNGFKYREKIRINGKLILGPWMDRKTDAKKWRTQKESERDRLKVYGVEVDFAKTFKEFKDEWLEKKKGQARRTYDSYHSTTEKYLSPRFGPIRLVDISRNSAEQLKSDLLSQGEIGITRINFILRVFKSIIGDAVKSGYLLDSKIKNVDFLPSQRRSLTYWTPDEARQFLASNRNSDLYYLYLIALNTGLRKGELCGLCWDKVDFLSGLIEISRTMERYGLKNETKSKKIRYVPMNESTREALISLHQKRTDSPFVFLRSDGKPIDYGHLQYRVFNRDVVRSGVKMIRFHDLRTTYASSFVTQGGDIFALSKILGHSSVKITEDRYAFLSQNYLLKNASKMEINLQTRTEPALKLLKS